MGRDTGLAERLLPHSVRRPQKARQGGTDFSLCPNEWPCLSPFTSPMGIGCHWLGVPLLVLHVALGRCSE